MHQKLSKCEVKAHSVEIQEFNWYPILREINFGKKSESPKLFFFFLQFETLNFEFW